MSLRDLFSWPEPPARVSSDPFDQPEVRRMSERELADLPWPRPQPVRAEVDAPTAPHARAA